ncbi:MAG: DUF1302 domain-containing protein [Polynucleobacter sp.]|nr:MAG: DUF1302 domain-containing protein [Polynucleobacter sp.]
MVVASAGASAQNLPDFGLTSGEAWQVDNYYENHTAMRESAGLSKFRNTLQSEMSKNLNDGWRFRGILRGTYDGVYDLNDKEYGKNAGGAVNMNHAGGPTPYGSSFLTQTTVAQALSLPNNTFSNGGAAFANTGLQILGSGWNNGTPTGLSFAVPVRPCDVDSRGCRDFGGYGDKKTSELAMPEFNDRLDFIREAYVTKTIGMDGGASTFLKIGKQQVVWGRTDLFRVLDVINPVDYSRNNIYDELQDIRIPMWIAQAEYRMGGSETMQDRNLSVVWNFDRFRPNNLGQGGTPNSILDTGNFFRSMANCWDNGCSVGGFGKASGGTGGWSTNFGPGQIGIHNVDLPNWSLSNTQLGAKFEGVTQDGLSFSLNALTYRSQLPSLRGMTKAGSNNPFTGNSYAGGGVPGTDPLMNGAYLPLFEVVYPRVNLVGGSMDFQIESVGAAMRLEGAYTSGEEFANTLRPELYSKNNVWRSVIGFDRPTFVPFISTERTVLFSGQLFYQHIFNHEKEARPWGMSGMPDWKDNVIGTLLMKAFLMNDRLSPEVIFARDFQAKANVVAPAVEWSATDNLKFKFGANIKFGTEQENWQWSSAHAANALNPFTAATLSGTNVPALTDYGLGGVEPLGRFRAGPIGTAFGQNEIFATMRYKF